MNRHRRTDILVIGAGPTGLGAANRLAEEGADWLVVERQAHAGGLAASFEQDGFTWDLGVHVNFSHYPQYDRMLDHVLPQHEWLWHRRTAHVRICRRWVPYPLQYNVWMLPAAEMRACVEGVVRLYADRVQPDLTDFQSFIDTHFGQGIARLFMNPYNRKLWARPPASLSADWIGERVPIVDLARLVHNAVERRQDGSWGPNSAFRYPFSGGAGEVWRRLAAQLPPDRILLNAQVAEVSTKDRKVTLTDGRTIHYDALISTMPLDRLVQASDMTDLVPAATGLLKSTIDAVGLGMRGAPPRQVEHSSWMYFPEDDCPFYRATPMTNCSPRNAPPGHWSLVLETAESAPKQVDPATLTERCIEGCLRVGILRSRRDVVMTWHRRAEYGYPAPSRDRDARLRILQPALEERRIFSRGRFGAWKYEIGNMDHSFMQGVETTEAILSGPSESTLNLRRAVGAGESG